MWDYAARRAITERLPLAPEHGLFNRLYAESDVKEWGKKIRIQLEERWLLRCHRFSLYRWPANRADFYPQASTIKSHARPDIWLWRVNCNLSKLSRILWYCCWFYAKTPNHCACGALCASLIFCLRNRLMGAPSKIYEWNWCSPPAKQRCQVRSCKKLCLMPLKGRGRADFSFQRTIKVVDGASDSHFDQFISTTARQYGWLGNANQTTTLNSLASVCGSVPWMDW